MIPSSTISKEYNLMVGERTAEAIKMKIGPAYPLDKEETCTISGRDLVTGLPKDLDISSVEIREALREPVNAVDSIRFTLEKHAGAGLDIMERGIMLTGGGGLFKRADQLISKETGIPVL